MVVQRRIGLPFAANPHRTSRPWGVFALALLFGCAGGYSTASYDPNAPHPSVVINPSSASLTVGALQVFRASVTGSSNLVVMWSIQEASGGTITNNGTYTAPATSGTYHVIAASAADPSKSSNATVTVTQQAPSVSVAVFPQTTSVAAGAKIQFTATVTGTSNGSVTWATQESSGCGSVDQTGSYSAPLAATTCHVMATSVADTTKSGSATVSVTPAAGPANPLGINVGAPMVWDPSTVYADGQRQGVFDATSVDSNGWPLTASFNATAGNDLTNANGRWTCYFDGTATITGVTPVDTIHGPNGTGPDGLPVGPNTRWFQFDVTTPARTPIVVGFNNAARNDGSGLAGLTNIKMMRPASAGSTTSNRRDETILRQVKSLVQRFGTVRYMDFLATNWSQITTWGGYPWKPNHSYQIGDLVTVCKSGSIDARSCGKAYQCTVAGTSAAGAGSAPTTTTWGGTVTDGSVTWKWIGWGRPLPSWGGFDRNEGTGTGSSASAGADFGWQGSGGPYEDLIKFANESGTDAWINLPHQVDDDYLTKVAQLFAFGSDGAMPYTSPQANPVYPPLNSNLNLYIEYSNEIWNFGFSQTTWLNSVANSDGVLDYNGDTTNLQYRFVGRRMARISNAFRAAFGDAQMPFTGSGRIRPVVMGQGAVPDQTSGIALKWIHEFLGDGDGKDHSAARTAAGFGAAAHPVRYYLWAVGGAPYWQTSGSTATAVLDGMAPSVEHDVYYGRMNRHGSVYGLPMIAYEGGPEVPQDSIGAAANMSDRPSNPNMRDTLISNHNEWSASGGGLFVYFTLSSDSRWCFVADNGYRGNLYAASPKMSAIDELKNAAPSPVTLSPSAFQNGTAIPGTVLGGAYTLYYSDGTFAPPSSGTGSRSLSASSAWQNAAGFAFLASGSSARTVSASLSGGGTAQCYVDGVKLGGNQQATGIVTCGTMTLGPGLHGVIIVAASGAVTVNSVTVN